MSNVGLGPIVFGGLGLILLVRVALPCSVSGHRRYYDSGRDESFCKKCDTKWSDASIDGTRAGKYTRETGWIYDGDVKGYDVHN